MPAVNDRIRQRRLSLNFTLLYVAEQLGVKEATVQRYESGEIKNIKHETIARLAEILKCSPGYLMGWETSIAPPCNFELSDLEEKIVVEFRKSDEITQAMVLRALSIEDAVSIKRDSKEMA